MKILSLIFLTIFLGKGCAQATNKDVESAVIVYEASSKGHYTKVEVQNHMVSVSGQGVEGGMKAKKISDADWNYLIEEFKKVDLKNMPHLISPSKQRVYDGAATANMTITYMGTQYRSSPFDHGNPPAEIKNLVDKITSFINEN